MTSETASGSERKREASESAEASTPKLHRVDTPADCVEHATACVESAKCSASESCSLWNDFRNNQDGAVEVFINQYYNKSPERNSSQPK